MNHIVLLFAVGAVMLDGASSPPKPLHPPVQPFRQQTHADFVERLKQVYREIDTKDRGYFSPADLVLPGYHIAHPPVPYPQAQMQAPFSCVDVNRDGKITEQEYVDYGARAFDATNWHGFLDPVTFSHAIAPDGGCK